MTSTEEQLQQQGWTKRFTTFGQRLKEAVDLFRELGFEVRLEKPEIPEDIPDSSCTTCLSQLERTIFVRPVDFHDDTDYLFEEGEK
ncbi:hypothetical protein K8I28_04870 [bacterium]|nr:hypothetical protein [bacterium]